jgi:hypothetical protein
MKHLPAKIQGCYLYIHMYNIMRRVHLRFPFVRLAWNADTLQADDEDAKNDKDLKTVVASYY